MRSGLSFVLGAVVGIVLAGLVAFGVVALVTGSDPNDIPKSEVEYNTKIGDSAKAPPNYGS